MGEVKNLKLVNKSERANKELQEQLKRLLAQAKDGHLSGIVLCGIDNNGSVSYELGGSCADNPALSLAIVVRLKAKIINLLL